jgi:predicted amidohydrolase
VSTTVVGHRRDQLSPTTRIACCQFARKIADLATNAALIQEQIGSAVPARADVNVLPEMEPGIRWRVHGIADRHAPRRAEPLSRTRRTNRRDRSVDVRRPGDGGQ